ncbi:early nodulin-like protein 18 [Cornus florida]|uniref:early nodulin-like protein 18 n=1 Tax=Cornus florida TaxID=4283 RepID=UPI002899ED83|nr:early nodulin-like protein 18 [Cornus florida]
MNRTLTERARSMRIHSGLPKQFWAEAVNTTSYLINRGPSVPLKHRIPEEVWIGKEVNLSWLKVFGCIAYVHIRVFKYKNGSNSVLVVKKDDYDKCNTEKPIMKMDDGDSVFKFDRSGPFFFISGNKDNSQKDQKLIVVVLAIRNHNKFPPVAVPPAPVGQTPASSPSPTKSSPSPAPATTPSPISHTTSATSLSPI